MWEGLHEGTDSRRWASWEGTVYPPRWNSLPPLPSYSSRWVTVMDLTFLGSTLWEWTWCWHCDFARMTLDSCLQASAEVRITYRWVSLAISRAPDWLLTRLGWLPFVLVIDSFCKVVTGVEGRNQYFFICGAGGGGLHVRVKTSDGGKGARVSTRPKGTLGDDMIPGWGDDCFLMFRFGD